MTVIDQYWQVDWVNRCGLEWDSQSQIRTVTPESSSEFENCGYSADSRISFSSLYRSIGKAF